MNSNKNIYTLANGITALRIVLLPPALFFFLQNQIMFSILALVLIVIMELSDLFDGMLARKLNQVTDFGKIFDPFADHIYRLSFFLIFFLNGMIPLWMFLVCFYRDSLVLNIRVFAAACQNTVVAARLSGKIKAIAQSTVIILFAIVKFFHLSAAAFNPEKLYYYMMLAVIIVTIWSAWDYLTGVLKNSSAAATPTIHP
jgi:CDP-diacylglycerol--glycerol-3-phosphate 3-phosphatidyltransferase